MDAPVVIWLVRCTGSDDQNYLRTVIMSKYI